VNFGGRTGVQSAIVVFTGPDGKPLQLGARGRLEGQGETFLVGHDGRAYVKDLGPTNSVVIELLDKECRATFTYAPTEGRQGIVRGVVCR
jgi:outer membrane usher protein